MRNRTDAEILRAGAAGFGLAALVTPAIIFILEMFRYGSKATYLISEGSPIFIALGVMLFICLPAFAIGLIAMRLFLAAGARSAWFALAGIGMAALWGAYLEYDGSTVPDLRSAALIGLHVALACGITIIILRRNIHIA